MRSDSLEHVYRRRTARVLVLDVDDRVLLLCYQFSPERRVWLAPGGGVKWWESLRKAAARELREEVGLVVDPAGLGLPVAHAEGYADLGWAKGQFRDDYFAHRVASHEVNTAAMESLERSTYAGHRWWSVDELQATTDDIVPWGLAGLLATLIEGAGEQGRRVRLPWHH